MAKSIKEKRRQNGVSLIENMASSSSAYQQQYGIGGISIGWRHRRHQSGNHQRRRSGAYGEIARVISSENNQRKAAIIRNGASKRRGVA